MARAVILASGGWELGMEATDEAFARAFARWAEVSTYANPSGWVYRVAVNWARSRMRGASREVGGMTLDVVYEDPTFEPELLEAVNRLPFRYRVVVMARFFLDWSVEQTAAALDVPTGTVKSRQRRALQRLGKTLGETR